LQTTKTRKSLVASGVLAIAALLLSACAPTGTQTSMSSTVSNQSPEDLKSKDGNLEVTLTAAENMVPFGSSTRWAMTYNGKTAGPTLHVRPGDKLTITLVNNLNKETSLHTHGLHVSPTQDDPFIMVAPGKSYTYTYDIPKNHAAGTFWYHPHMHGITAEQVASGLSGAILVEAMDDDAIAASTTNRVLVINDPPITDKNPWDSASGGMSGMSGMSGMGGMGGMDQGQSSGVDMMTAMMGRTGPKLLTNGFEGITLTASKGKLERLHIVNATASSRLTFAYSGAKMILLSSEGGRLASPIEIKSLILASAERAEVILIPNGDGGSLSAQRLSNEAGGELLGKPEKIATISLDAGTDTSVIPTSFKMANTRDLFSASEKVASSRVVTLSGHMPPTIDGNLFDPNVVNFTAKKGTVQEWTIKNTTPMFHPIHIHTWGFQVTGEQGWQDVVVVPPNSEKVIRIAFDDFSGTTVVHCHILDHEDTGMMAIIKVD
jgi:FtsP/CotA-like multicopper oxidase with cupredoxin domain